MDNQGFTPGEGEEVRSSEVERSEPDGKQPEISASVVPQVYPIRWLMLVIFVLCSASSAFHWNEYAIINNLIHDYYGVDVGFIDWTSILYEITYIPLIFPASYFLEKQGLRKSLLIGMFGTMAGSWVKVASVSPDLWWLTFTGQFIVASSQSFILGLPARLAAVWFGPEQVSTACAIGVFGNQLGIALGFLLPPLIVSEHNIGKGLQAMFYGQAGFITAVFILVVVVFKDTPPTPPSATPLEQEDTNYLAGIKRLMSNPGYVLLLLSYGINVGVFYGISTLLNQMVLEHFPTATQQAGQIGLLIVLAGMLGSVVCGLVLDKTARFKLVTVVLYVMSFAFCLAYTFIFSAEILWLVFVIAALMGFFMTGYLPVGFEFAAELTYPEAEGTSSGLLNASAQFFGIFTTLANGKLLHSYGDIPANLTLVAVLVVGAIMTMLIPEDLRRQRALKSKPLPA